MIHKIHYLLLLAATVLTLGGCAKDPVQDTPQGKQINLGLNLGTYASADDSNAFPHEIKIHDAYVFIYTVDGLLENPGNTKVRPRTDGNIVDAAGRLNGTWKVYEGEKTIYVVANVPESLRTKSGITKTIAALDHPTLDELQELCTSGDNFVNEYMQDQDESWKGGLMSGSKSETITVTTPEVTVPLVRRYARIDLAVRKAPELADAKVIVKQFQSKSYSRQSALLETVPEWDGSESVGNYFDDLNQSIESEYTPIKLQMKGKDSKLYFSPRPAEVSHQTPDNTIPHLSLTVFVNGREETYVIYLVKTGADGKQDMTQPLAIEANKIYKVNATLNSRAIDVEIKILDWDDQAIQGDIAGSTLSVSQSKVVMDWWNLGEKFDTSVDYVSDGTVEFVGYVVKKTTATQTIETLTTNGSNLPTWLPVGKITNLPDGSTKTGRVGLEYVITPDAHPDVTLRIKTGNIVKDITVVYDNGLLQDDMLKQYGWAADKLPGSGIHVTKIGNILPSEAAAQEERSFRLLAVSQYSNYPDYPFALEKRGFGFGPVNTEFLYNLYIESAAASSCRALGKEWYISSADEISVTSKAIPCYGPSYTMIKNYYWTSTLTPKDQTPSQDVHGIIVYHPRQGAHTASLATNRWPVRCVRNMGVNLSTTTLVADWYNWGESFSTDVEFESTTGDVSVLSIDNIGATKDWLVSAVVSGTTKGKLRVTYQPTAGNGGVHDDVMVLLRTAKGTITAMTIKYDNGFLPNAVLATPGGWKTDQPHIGLHLAKRGNLLPEGVAVPTDPTIPWSPINEMIGIGDTGTKVGFGENNTADIAFSPSGPGSAAAACHALGERWYLSSHDELEAVEETKWYTGPSYSFPSNYYWTSSEINTSGAWTMSMSSGSGSFSNKSGTSLLRCVRNIDLVRVSTIRLFADYAVWGNSFSTDVEFESIDGPVSIDAIDNGNSENDWLVSAVLVGTTTKGKVRITYKPTAGNESRAGYHGNVIITLRSTGGATKSIRVIYNNGFLPNALLASAGEWTTNLPTTGVQMTKMGTMLPNQIHLSSPRKWSWSTGSYLLGFTGASDRTRGAGASNTTKIINALGPDVAQAANACRELGPEWYLPSIDELQTLGKLKNYFGQYYFCLDTHWSSTEQTGSTAHNAFSYKFEQTPTGHPIENTQGKQTKYTVRCLRDL